MHKKWDHILPMKAHDEEDELTYNVLADFHTDFIVSGSRRSFDVLLDEGVDTFAAISAAADLDDVTMVAKMNAHPLSCIIAVDVEDFGNAWCNALGKLLADLAY
jgi:hypothetical protein